MFFLLYKYTDDAVSEDFRPLFEDFRRFSKIVPKARRTFPKISRKFPKISEDIRRLPKTFEKGPKMFRWYTNEFKYKLDIKLDITEIIDIFTCEDIISSHVRILYRFYQFVTTRYTTDFNIIKQFYLESKASFIDISSIGLFKLFFIAWLREYCTFSDSSVVGLKSWPWPKYIQSGTFFPKKSCSTLKLFFFFKYVLY